MDNDDCELAIYIATCLDAWRATRPTLKVITVLKALETVRHNITERTLHHGVE